MHINKLYKTIMIIAMVVGPLYWLMVTEDGIRRTDTLMLWLAGGDPININFKVLDHQYSIDEWKKVFPDINWQCSKTTTSWGDEVCYSEISSYNGIPAYYVSVFFANGNCSGLKLVYRNQYHNQIGEELQYQLGSPQVSSQETEKTAGLDKILKWNTGYGMVLLKQKLNSGEEEASLLWIPNR